MIYFLKQFKGIAYFLAMLILFQSCAAYKKQPIPLLATTKSINKKVKVRTKDGVNHKFDRIDVKFESDYIVGYRNNKKGVGPIRISIQDIDMIKIHNKTTRIIWGIDLYL